MNASLATSTDRTTIELLLVRVGGEVFGLELSACEEAIEMPPVDPVPEMPAGLLGVATVRGRLVPVYSPERALGVTRRGGGESGAGVLLVMRAWQPTVALALDDVEDVMTLDLATMERPPGGEVADAVLVALARRGGELVGVLDAEGLLRACVAQPSEDR